VEKEDLIVHLLRESRVDIKEIKDDISNMSTEVALNRQDLELHMEQTRSVKELTIVTKDELLHLIKAVEKRQDDRIEAIENRLTATYLLKLIVTVASGLGMISGAIYGVIRIVNSF